MIPTLAATDAAFGLPIGDWQFWVVSGLALCGAVLVVRPLLPSSKAPPPPCGGCGGGNSRSGNAASRAKLTIGGEIPDGGSPRGGDLR